MSAHSDRRRGAAWAAAWALFGAVLLVASWRMDRLEDRGINPWSAPGLTPGVVGVLMVALALVLLWQALRPGAAGVEPIDAPAAAAAGTAHDALPEASRHAAPADGSWRCAALALLLCLVFAVGALGRGLPFWIDAALFIFVFTAAFSLPQWRAQQRSGSSLWRPLAQTAAVAVVSSGLISWLFQTVFLVRLP